MPLARVCRRGRRSTSEEVFGLSGMRDAMIAARGFQWDTAFAVVSEIEFLSETESMLLLAQSMYMRWRALASLASQEAAMRGFGGVHVALVRSVADGARMEVPFSC